MNTQKLLGAELLAALATATIGAEKLPRPSRYTGVFVLWFTLGLVAQVGPQAARFASALGGLVVLTMAMGQAGVRVLGWFGQVGPRLGVPASGSPAGGGDSTSRGGNLTAPRFPNPRAGGRPRQRPT